jgi:hypothetical protein
MNMVVQNSVDRWSSPYLEQKVSIDIVKSLRFVLRLGMEG